MLNIKFSLYNKFVDPKFYKFLYIIAFFALVIAIITIYEGMSEINKFFNERIKI